YSPIRLLLSDRACLGLVSPWAGIIGLPLGASNELVQRCSRAAWLRVQDNRRLVNLEGRYPALDLITTKPHKTMNLDTGNTPLRSPRIERGGVDTQCLCQLFDRAQYRDSFRNRSGDRAWQHCSLHAFGIS